MSIGFVFSSAPFGCASGREGLDAVLATSNYSEDLALFFIADGVMQLIAEQDSSELLCRDHVKTFRMLPMCEVERIYVCQQSLQERGLSEANLVVGVEVLTANTLAAKMAACAKLMHF